MFGYITTNTQELKVKEFESYRGFYCGLCKSLKKNHGRRGQITLSYDMTFLIILLTGLYEPKTLSFKKRCGFHFFQKQKCLDNVFTKYASDMSILLTYNKLIDDWKDERLLTRKIYAVILKAKYKKVQKLYPEKSRIVMESLDKISECEARDEENIDLVSGYFGELLGELFIYKKDEWENSLQRMGFFLGKFIYLMDAYDDLDKDKKTGNYNPLLALSSQDDYEIKCRQILTMMMSECAKEFEKIPIIEHSNLLRNILYSGVWSRYEAIQKNRKDSNHDSKSL